MYCEYCGKKIDLDSIFCEHCGKKVKKSKFRFIWKESKVFFIVFLFLAFGFLFFLELQYFNSPNNALKRYLKNWTNENYGSILENYDSLEGEFTTGDILKEVAYETDEYLMTDFKVSSCELDQKKTSAICYVNYHMKKNGLTYEKTYYLEKKNSRKLGIFSEWDIKNHDLEVISDFKLFLPKDSNGTLIGNDLQTYRNVECDKAGYDCYILPKILSGNYPLKIIMNTGISLEKNIKVSNKDYTYQFQIEDASSEFRESTIQLATELVELFYNGAANQKEFKDLETNYDIDLLSSTYTNLKKDLESASLVDFRVQDMKLKEIKMNEDGEILLSFQMAYEYNLKYKKDDKVLEHHGESNDTFYVTAKNVELNEIVKIDSLVTYFSKKY